MKNKSHYQYHDFTLDHYKELLQIAKKKFVITDFINFKETDNCVVWRHDVDFSVAAALTLAKIEATSGISATYFFHCHNNFYNLLEKETTNAAKEIIKLGHDVGIHFDCDYYNIQNEAELEQNLLREKRIFEELFESVISVFSFHNTTPFILSCNQWKYGGMINTYADYFQSHVDYCSDSNGFWRYRRLQDVLEDDCIKRLQVLTHPGWWLEHPISPRDKVSLHIEKRAKDTHLEYDQLLEVNGRENIK